MSSNPEQTKDQGRRRLRRPFSSEQTNNAMEIKRVQWLINWITTVLAGTLCKITEPKKKTGDKSATKRMKFQGLNVDDSKKRNQS